MAHIHDVYDQDNHFVIDPITRDITSQSEKISITQYDHNSERFTFEIPKIIEGHDMSRCDKVRVHFINIGSNRSNVSKGVYEVDDIRVSSDDSNMLLFSWLISRAATEYSGKLNFSIRFYCISDDNIVDYSWATSIFTGIKISNSIDNSEAITEDYVDILEQWKSEIAMKIDDIDSKIENIEIPEIPTKLPNPQSLTFTGAAEGTYDGSSALTVDIPSAPDIPTTLPNPQSLTFTGAAEGTYDGSSALTVDIPSAPEIPDISGKMDKNNPTGTGSFSLNRKASTVVGTNSHAEGDNTTASASSSHAEGVNTTASGYGSHAEGVNTIASGVQSHAEGAYTKASSYSQHVQGEFNIEDSSDVYADVIGNGTSESKRSNAATVDWSGNAWYAGDVYVGSTSGTNKDEGSKKLATEEYVNNSVSIIEIPTALADLITDSTHRLVTDTEKSTWNAKAEVSAIPTKASQLTNDSDFATNSDVTTGISTHNSSTEAHNDIRLLVQELTNKLNTLADSDDTTLDQLSEIVAYTKNNKSLIDSITTSKVSVTDIIDNLTTSATNKPLSAKQGVALKALIDAIVVPTKLPNPNAITFTGAVAGTYDGSSALTVDIPSAPEIPTTLPIPQSLTFTGAVNARYNGSSEVSGRLPGALSDLSEDATHRVVTDAEKAKWNAKSNFSGSYNDLTDKPIIPDVPVQSVNGKTGAVILSAEDVGALPGSTVIPEALPNPNALNFTGAVTGSYDGSAPLSVNIPKAPTVPKNISAFNNDAGYLTEHQDISGKIDRPASGVVGQVLAVKTVDENGKPTEWKTADVSTLIGSTIPIVNSVEEMTDTSKEYMLASRGTIWRYQETMVKGEVTQQVDGDVFGNSRLGSDGSIQTGTGYSAYVTTPFIDLLAYPVPFTLHLDGGTFLPTVADSYTRICSYTENETKITCIQVTNGAVRTALNVPTSQVSATVDEKASITFNDTPKTNNDNHDGILKYVRFSGKGTVDTASIYVTYEGEVAGFAWVDTGISGSSGGSGSVSQEVINKISSLNNEGEDPATVKLLSSPVLEFYNSEAYPDDDYSVTHLSKITYPCRADIPVPYTVKWSHNENAMRTTVAVDKKSIGNVNAYTMRTYDATGMDNYPIYNLLPNTTYYYKVTHVLSDGSLIEAKSGSFTTSSETWRLLYIDGTQNVRDLGGWTGLNGKKVKYGKIIRGAALSDSSGANMIVTGKGRLALGELNIQAELNLGAIDNATSIAANCAYKKIGYTNYAIAITDEIRRAQFKEVLEWIVSCLDGTLNVSGLYQVQRNIYMHCQGGCDRTGTLSFQLLGLLGVSESDLAKEYELSSFSDVGFGRLRTTTKAVDTYDYVGMVEALKTYSGDTITDKFVSFALDCGISNDTITNFRNLMLE